MASARMETPKAVWERGYIQIYTGDGKGKTTMALGLALRAMGWGLRTYIGQFMKGSSYGELRALESLKEWITVEQYGGPRCIPLREQPSEEDIRCAREGLTRAREAMYSGEYHIVILDEVNVAIGFHLLSEEEVLDFMDQKPSQLELICTGRRAPQALIERADLVSEVREVKHYYHQGIRARAGIER